MSVIKTYNPETGTWEVRGASQASSIGVVDILGNFESDNVEGCLREVKEKIDEQSSSVEAVKQSVVVNNYNLTGLREEFDEHLANHPTGGGGSGDGTDCKITSSFVGGVIELDGDLTIPIFFSSTKKGTGTAYILVNNIEVGMKIIEQGQSTLVVGKLIAVKNNISIYVKDSSGAVSNMLEWDVTVGAIDLKLNFDFNLDYSVGDTIRIPYEITTAIEEPLTLQVTYDGKLTELPITKGYGEKKFLGKDLGIGIHTATVRVISGIFKSKAFTVSLVVVSSYELYLSSTFKETTFELGKPIIIPYRISKLSTEIFSIRRYINGNLDKTLSNQAGVYTWTVTGLPMGQHVLRVEVDGASGDSAFITFNLNIVAGEYVPQEVVKSGLMAWYDAFDMSNQDDDRETWIDKSGNNVLAKLINFNFQTNGWVEEKDSEKNVIGKVLTCDNGAYVEIDCTPFNENAIYGTTVEILYKSKNIGDESAVVLDCSEVVGQNEDGSPLVKGITINVTSAVIKSAINTGKVTLDEDTETRVTYVLDRFSKFCLIYVDAILCRAFYLTDAVNGPNRNYEDFQHVQKIYLNGEKGLDKTGACDIKTFRVYNRALTSEEVIQNHIADIKDLKAQKAKYDFNFKNSTIPVIRMYADKSKFDMMSGAQSVPVRVRYESPNPTFYGESFDYPKCDVMWQGSSSLTYVLKNYTIYLKDENMSDVLYTPFQNGVPENAFCLKADYIESSHANNLGLAKFVHDCLYDSKTPVQAINPNYRTTVDGFPILLYINYNDDVGDRLLGCYNFNLDRYSTYSYGYHETSVKCLAYEINANSDVTAGAFNEWTALTGKDETTYYNEDFKILYPPSRKGNDNYEEIKRLIRWVSSASDEVFKDQINEYFNLEYLLRYYLFVMTVGAVDSLGFWLK